MYSSVHLHLAGAVELAASADLVILGLVYVNCLLLLSICVLRPRKMPPAATQEERQEWPLVSVLVPAYNEERVIEATLRSLLAADYPAMEIIVIDDGSRDRTAEIAAGLAAGDPRISVLKLPQNQGKALALNAGIAAARAEYLVVIDADTIPDSDFLKLIVSPLLNGRSDAVAGNVKVGHTERSGAIEIFQSIEYVSVLNLTRLLQGVSNTITTVPGAAGALRKAAVYAAGGYSPRTKAEDADLTLQLVANGFRVSHEPRAIVHTEVPSTWRSLLRQRLRWIHGNMQCIWRRPGVRCAGNKWWFYGLPAFFYENFCKPPLEFCRAAILLLAFESDLHPALFYGWLTLFTLNGAVVALSYRLGRQNPRELIYLPIQYVIWPIFMIIPYCLAVWHLVFRRQVAWQKSTRTGDFAATVVGTGRPT